MGAHDAAHATVEEGSSNEAHVILAVHQHVTEQKSVSISLELEQIKRQEKEKQT